jgi:hypothetical protein
MSLLFLRGRVDVVAMVRHLREVSVIGASGSSDSMLAFGSSVSTSYDCVASFV